MKSTNKTRKPVHSTQKASPRIEVRVAKRNEIKRFDALLDEKHPLGRTRPIGDFVRQIVCIDDEWVALFVWGPCAYRLADRDEWIGWPASVRAERQKLIVQNRRFLILADKGTKRNLASRCLGAAVRELRGIWMERFGYTPLLAETFTDFEQGYEGTCYRAAGWTAVGFSKGNRRHRADFYQEGESPKKLWLKPLVPDAVTRLCAPAVDEAQMKGAQSNAHGVMPIKDTQLRSLSVALQQVPDPRKRASPFRCGVVLCITVMAVFSGHNNIKAIHRFASRLTQAQRTKLGLPFKKGTKVRQIPSYSVFYSLLEKMDLNEFARVLNGWLQDNEGTLPKALAVDGKFIRDNGGVLSFVHHDTGVPERMVPVKQKEKGDLHEVKAAQKAIVEGPALDGAILTFDALHTQDKTARAVVEKGGDYIIQVKGNRKNLRKAARHNLKGLPPFTHRPTANTED